MTITENKIESLLNTTKRILAHQQEIQALRGEQFNVFSILGMESRENDTHSAFLAELLNPKGSHLLGDVFLRAFINEIDYTGALDLETTKVITEMHVGTRNDDQLSGGRIDIYLIDLLGNSISLENKIYASDQNAQIARYVNHNKEKNTVYYLTLTGQEASEESAVEMKEGEHYFAISYEANIINWLEVCLKEAASHPILRETIKQYSILIKKLTNQLSDKKMEKEITELIKANYHEAKAIEANLWKVEMAIALDFLNKLKSRVAEELNNEEWVIEVTDNLENSYEGFQMYNKHWKSDIAIKLEGQSKIPWHNVILGFIAPKDKVERTWIQEVLNPLNLQEIGYSKESRVWPYYQYVLPWRDDSKRAELFDPLKSEILLKDLTGRILYLAKGSEKLLLA